MRYTLTHVFFYSGPFSQWFPSPFRLDGKRYSCAEQYMMAEKARFFRDEESWDKIMATTDPAMQKLFGRQVKNFYAEAWSQTAYALVVNGNMAKFSQNDVIRRDLIQSVDRIIVEASPTDAIWGIGLALQSDLIFDESNWRGTNLLGKALMEVRSLLS